MNSLGITAKYAYNIGFSADMSPVHEALIVAKTLFPGEVMSLAHSDVSAADRNSATKLRTTLENGFKHGTDDEAVKAESVSKQLGAIVATHLDHTINAHPPFTFGHGTLGFNGAMIDIGDTKRILDHGIGMNGVLSHRTHIKEPDHFVFATAEDDVEAFGLEGAAAKLGYPEGSFMALPDAEEASEIALDVYGQGSFDLALLSRIHMMGKKSMQAVLKSTPELLRPGGLVVVCAPQYFSRGFNAEQQADGMLKDDRMQMVESYAFENNGPQGDPNPQQAFVLRKSS